MLGISIHLQGHGAQYLSHQSRFQSQRWGKMLKRHIYKKVCVKNYSLSPSCDVSDVFNMICNCLNVRLSIRSNILRRKVDLPIVLEFRT